MLFSSGDQPPVPLRADRNVRLLGRNAAADGIGPISIRFLSYSGAVQQLAIQQPYAGIDLSIERLFIEPIRVADCLGSGYYRPGKSNNHVFAATDISTHR